MKSLMWFCGYVSEDNVNKLMKSTTVVRFFSFVPSSLLRTHCRAKKATDAKNKNDKYSKI